METGRRSRGVLSLSFQSARKKETGSTVAARVAGTTLATALTAKSTKTTGTSVMGETASNENPRSTFEISTISGSWELTERWSR